MESTYRTWRLAYFVLEGTVDNNPGFLAIAFDRDAVPVVISKSARCLNTDGKWAAAGLVLEVDHVTAIDGNYDVVVGTLAVDDNCIVDSRLKLKVYVTAMSHFKGW